ncbi:MAG: protein translocase subunit SecD, partial [Candidatus Sericytochromatia bacterium]|nr:protein translocase subunit SecD [Candidatus Tanganyikabacteria bacterium]
MRLLRRLNLTLVFIIAISSISAWAVAQPDIRLGDFRREGMRLGLDISGGTHLVLQGDVSESANPTEAMRGAKDVIERRINALGLTEPVVQLQGDDRILVQLPGVGAAEARALIGATARLDFREVPAGASDFAPATGIGSDGLPKRLTGEYLKPNSFVSLDPTTGEPVVNFEFDAEGARLFSQITRRNLGRPLGIFLDDQLLSAPTVQAEISERGIITGLTATGAKNLAIQLNAGALPVPVEVIQESEVDAVLGSDSIRQSLIAGGVGLAVVLAFMIIYYRMPGLVAGGALIVYTVIALAVFKLIPVTLTLAGIAAFILSIGMAVDANILVFERLKEELRAGRSLAAAMEAGFARAWSSIRDSNVSTLITCAILFWFGSQPAFSTSLVRGFAITLALGVLI